MGKGPRKQPINSEMNKGVDPRILIQADCCALAGVLIPLNAMPSRHVRWFTVLNLFKIFFFVFNDH